MFAKDYDAEIVVTISPGVTKEPFKGDQSEIDDAYKVAAREVEKEMQGRGLFAIFSSAWFDTAGNVKVKFSLMIGQTPGGE